MEWQLPIQKMEISNIHIGSPWLRGSHTVIQKPLAPLSYFGPQFRLPFVSLLFPPLLVKEYNPITGRLALDMSESNLACIKLNTLQETLTNAIFYHQYSWFKTDYSKEEIKAGFQHIYNDSTIYIHCPIQQQGKGIPVYDKQEWKSLSSDVIQAGMRIRVGIKIHGISFLHRSENDNQRGANDNQRGAYDPQRAQNGTNPQQEKWTGRCRLQHRIQGVIIQT